MQNKLKKEPRRRPITVTINITGLGSLGSVPVELFPKNILNELIQYKHDEIQREYERIAEKERRLNDFEANLQNLNKRMTEPVEEYWLSN